MSVWGHNNAAGFSLIEVMVAIFDPGIALAGLTTGITTALGSSKESELQTTRRCSRRDKSRRCAPRAVWWTAKKPATAARRDALPLEANCQWHGH